MRLLVLAPSYPHRGHRFAGLFNERCVFALRELCETVEVVAPRPYCPPGLSRLSPRWKAYSSIPPSETRAGTSVWRPAYIQAPRFGAGFWGDRGAFLCTRAVVRRLQRRAGFEAILSFDLLGTGGLAWRLGQDLGLPAAGWATGNDVRVPRSSASGRVLGRALEHLDLIFYQSRELLEVAAAFQGIDSGQLKSDRHLVLARGVPTPPVLPRPEVRARIRSEWGIGPDRVVVLSIGRIVRDKGVFELLDAMAIAARRDPRLHCVLVGSMLGFDQASEVEKRLRRSPDLARVVSLLPAIDPSRIWEYLCAADIFAFTSYREGMPNSVLEAMAMEVPVVAFGIPPVLEIESGKGCMLVVPPFDVPKLADAVVRLAASPQERTRIGREGKVQMMERFMLRKNMALAVERLSSLRAPAPSFLGMSSVG